jgi:low temperature requirement protein LtrA
MLWWAYFDVVALVAARRLASIEDRQQQNETARDSYSYLHLPMVAGIVLLALGLKKTIENVDDPLKLVPAFALVGGVAIYLLAHVAFRWRNVHSINRRRLALGIGLFALLPLAVEIPALATLAIVTVIACVLIAYEAIRYADRRDRIRHEVAAEAR